MSSYRPTIALINLLFAHEKKASSYSCNYHLWSYPQSTAKKLPKDMFIPGTWKTTPGDSFSLNPSFMRFATGCCMCIITALRITPGMWWSMAPHEETEKPIQSSEGKEALNCAYAHTWKVRVHVILLSTLKIHAAMSWGNCSRGPWALRTCWMWEHLPYHPSVDAAEDHKLCWPYECENTFLAAYL